MGNFKKWLERADPFGFEEEDVPERLSVPDDQPHDIFPIEYICNMLKKRQFNGKNGFSKFTGEVTWGINPGALKVEFGPQYQVYIQKKISSFDGEPSWITKKVLRMDVEEYRDSPETVEDAIAKEIEKVAKNPVESPNKDISEDKMEELTLDLVNTIQSRDNNKFFFYEKSKKIEPFRYVIQLGAKNSGTGVLHTSSETNKINSMNIELNADKEKGLIKIFVYTAQSGSGNRYFIPQSSFFNANFSISQPKDEIISTIMSVLKFY